MVVVAIDGPAGAGKSSVAEELARRLGVVRVDTGAMYRAVTLCALEEGIDLEDGIALGRLADKLDMTFTPHGIAIGGHPLDREIRSPSVNASVSAVSRHSQVRRVLVAKQQEFAKQGDVVIEGRDIGSVVAPGADFKIFLTASPRERASRRCEELREAGHLVDLEELQAEMEARDMRDNATTPLTPTPGAVTIDSTEKSRDQVVSEIVDIIKSART